MGNTPQAPQMHPASAEHREYNITQDQSGGSEQEELLLGALENGDFETALQLVPRDDSTVRLGPDKLTPLHYACHHGRTDIVRLLITEFNYTFENRGTNGETPLHTASKNGHLDCIEEYMRIQNSRPQVRANLAHDEVIMEPGHELPNFSPQDKNGDTPLHIAASHGQLPVVRYLTETAHCDLHCKNVADQTPFHLAAKYGCLNIVRYFLDKHSHLAHEDYQIRNALFLAAENEQLEVLMYLIHELHCPEYLKIRINSGQTILHAACHKGDLDTVIKLTREFNCDPTCCDENGDTPLHLASAHGHLEVVRFLTDDMHCSPLCRNRDAITPLHTAAIHGHVAVLAFFIRNKQCNPTFPGWKDKTALHYASQEGHSDVVRFLTIQVGVRPSLSDKNGITPLHLASAQGHLEIVRFLTNEMHCDPLCQSTLSKTPFHWAALYGHVNIIRFFLEEKQIKYDKICQDYYGRTPLHYASEAGKLDVVKYLTNQAKADPLAKDNTLYSSKKHTVRNPFLCAQDLVAKSSVDLACKMNRRDTAFFLASKGAKSSNRKLKRWNPLSPRMKICTIGYHATGKTTLVAALQNESRNVPIECPPHTTGIVPTDFSAEFGNITFYDFAGEKEYYAGHEAILGDLSHPLYLVVLDLRDSPDKIENALHFWEFLIYNALSSNCQRNGVPPDMCTLLAHIIAVGSHSDCLTSGELQFKSEALAQIMEYPSHFPSLKHAMHITLDCRRPSSEGMNMLHQKIQAICKQVYSQADFDYENGHLLRTFVEQHLSHLKACNFNELVGWVLDVEDTKFQPLKSPQVLYQACKALNVSGDLILLTEGESPDDSWLVLNKNAFLREVHSLMPDFEKFEVMNGVLSHSKVKSVALDTDLNPELVIRYMCGMDMCTKIDANHIPGYNPQRGEKYYFFPSLINAERPDDVWTPSTEFTQFFGWCLRCTEPHQFFTPKCVNMLLLSIHKLVPNLSPNNCRIWKYGICWWNPEGIEAVVEVSQQCKKLVAVMRCLKESEVKFIKQRSSVIEQVLSIQKTFCPEVNAEELVIHTRNPHQHYPIEVAAEILMTDVASSIVNNHPYVTLSGQEHQFLELNDLIFFEPYQGLDNELLGKIFNPQNPKERVSESDLDAIATAVQTKWKLLAGVLAVSPQVIARLERDTTSDPFEKCKNILTSWSQISGGTYIALRQDLGQHSIFLGRNPLDIYERAQNIRQMSTLQQFEGSGTGGSPAASLLI